MIEKVVEKLKREGFEIIDHSGVYIIKNGNKKVTLFEVNSVIYIEKYGFIYNNLKSILEIIRHSLRGGYNVYH